MKKFALVFVMFFAVALLLSNCKPSAEDLKAECMKTEQFKTTFGENHEGFCDCWSEKAAKMMEDGKSAKDAGADAATECMGDFLNL